MITPIEIVRRVAKFHKVEEAAILGEKDIRDMTVEEMRARRTAVLAVIEQWPDWPYAELGGFFQLSAGTVRQLVLSNAGPRRNGLWQMRAGRCAETMQ